jgi:hypothetical protein
MTTPDVKRAFDALSGKLLKYNALFAYAEGAQPTVYATQRLREAFANLDARFTQNWCAVVVDAALDRLAPKGWDVDDEATNAALDKLWSDLRLGLDAYEAHKDALIASEAFVIAWKDGETLDVYHNDPRTCHVFYDPARPKLKQFAAKWWVDSVWHLTLYYPDHLEYYETRSKQQPATAAAFRPAAPEQAPNPFGVIPVFHFRGPGELGNILTLQDAVNKLFADMMVAAEYGAFKQRWIITNSDTETLKNGPNMIWTIPAGDGQGQQSSVGQFDATPLDNYLEAIDKIASAIAIISRTPKHYLYGSGANISGEALLAMEAPLTKKVDQYQERFAATWQELGAFLARLAGIGDFQPVDLQVVWQPSESVQPLTEALTRKAAVEAGVPLVTQLRWEGKDAGEIKALEKEREEERDGRYTVPAEWNDEQDPRKGNDAQ